MKGMYKAEVFETIPYNIRVQKTQAQRTSQTTEIQPFQSPLVLAPIGVSILGFLFLAFSLLFSKRR